MMWHKLLEIQEVWVESREGPERFPPSREKKGTGKNIDLDKRINAQRNSNNGKETVGRGRIIMGKNQQEGKVHGI